MYILEVFLLSVLFWFHSLSYISAICEILKAENLRSEETPKTFLNLPQQLSESFSADCV